MSDAVNQPSHYMINNVRVCINGRTYYASVECRDVIDALDMGRWLAQALQYLWRAGRKGVAIEDLRKAQRLIQFEIDRIERGEE
jgi:hypothetical protein